MRFLLAFLLFFIGSVQAKDLSDLRTYGNPAPVDLYLFTSVDCPHCRDFHKTIFPEILKRFVNTNRIQLYIVDMPKKEAAMQATMLMHCLPDDKASKLMNWLYDSQDRWKKAKNPKNIFLQYAQSLGLSVDDFNECLSNQQLKDAIVEQYEQLRILYQVRGTPTTVLRKGNVIKHYVGSERKAILYGLEKDISDYEKEQQERNKSKAK